MKLYIDTNIYLSFISPTSDIKSLIRLKKLINEQKVELILPSQTKQEFIKNFKSRVAQEKSKIENAKSSIEIPNLLKGVKRPSKEEKSIIKQIDDLNSDLKIYHKTKLKDFKNHIDSTEKLLDEIFTASTFFEYTDDIVQKALIRYAKGLPPKKNDFKFGDSIIWETLKDNIRNEDLVIVSHDGDFAENSNKPLRINKTLAAEWKKERKRKISLHKVLGEFINTLDKQDVVDSDTIDREIKQANALHNQYVIAANDQPAYILNNGSLSVPNIGAATYKIPNASNLVINPNSNLANLSSYRINYQENDYSAYILGNNKKCSKCGKDFFPGLLSVSDNLCAECTLNKYQHWDFN